MNKITLTNDTVDIPIRANLSVGTLEIVVRIARHMNITCEEALEKIIKIAGVVYQCEVMDKEELVLKGNNYETRLDFF